MKALSSTEPWKSFSKELSFPATLLLIPIFESGEITTWGKRARKGEREGVGVRKRSCRKRYIDIQRYAASAGTVLTPGLGWHGKHTFWRTCGILQSHFSPERLTRVEKSVPKSRRHLWAQRGDCVTFAKFQLLIPPNGNQINFNAIVRPWIHFTLLGSSASTVWPFCKMFFFFNRNCISVCFLCFQANSFSEFY